MKSNIRHNWSRQEINELFALPFIQLLYQALSTHLQNFPANQIQLSSILNIKSGNCSENCFYCAQSRYYKTGIKKYPLLRVDTIVMAAKKAKAAGATRFCMDAAWKSPPRQQFAQILEMVKEVKNLGLETCMTLGSLNDKQVKALKKAGLDYYNHNLDTSREYYCKIITSHSYDERIATLAKLRKANIKVCSGGIIGIGESKADRVGLLFELANLPSHPNSVPINRFIPIVGTPLENVIPEDPLELIRVIAIARILMPKSFIRLAAGRSGMSDELQTLAFAAGANSIFYGDKLLTSDNPDVTTDLKLLHKLGISFSDS